MAQKDAIQEGIRRVDGNNKTMIQLRAMHDKATTGDQEKIISTNLNKLIMCNNKLNT